MVAIPKPEVTMIDKIYAAIEKKLTRPFRLTRIGASGIGNPCLRAIWYDWRGYDSPTFDGRMRRLFETGEHQEVRIQQDLQLAGYQVWTHDDEGNQFTATDETGHFVCKLDGVIKGVNGAEKTLHDLEIKTHSFKSFDEVVERANSLPLGLASYAFIQSARTSQAISEAIEAGMVGVNSLAISTPETPFGGIKHSGHGHEGGIEGLEAYMNLKFIAAG